MTPVTTNWLTSIIGDMNTVGLFEAKTKLSELCQRVLSTGESLRITRRGKTIAILSPPAATGEAASVWDRRRLFEREHGRSTEDFEIPVRKVHRRTLGNPLD